MKQYLLSMYQPDGGTAAARRCSRRSCGTSTRCTAETKAAGALGFNGGPPSAEHRPQSCGSRTARCSPPTARSPRAKEHIGGFTIVKAPDLDAALEWGRKLARAITPPDRGAAVRGRGRGLIAGVPAARRLGDRTCLPRGVRPRGGRPGPPLRRHRRRRGGGPGRVHRGGAAVAVRRTAAEPGRMDHHHGPQPRDRPLPPRGVARRPARPGRACCTASDEPAEEGAVRDDRLRLIFTCCHPALATGAQVALTLRLLGGLDHRGDRARVPGARADDGAAAGAGEGQDPRRADSVPGAGRGRSPAPPRAPCSPSST